MAEAGGASTGSCAAAAARGAAQRAAGLAVERVQQVPLPGGGRIAVELLAWGGRRHRPWASVRKPWNGDPDATRAAVVTVALSRSEAISFRAGPGVGVVTRPGLQLPPGEPAVNPGPRRQIAAALAEVPGGPWRVRISVPGGAGIAARTFNPRLGIEGGISILGTAGIVRPWSEAALAATAAAHLGVVRSRGQDAAVLVPGHMGERAAARLLPGLECVEAGNSWGLALDRARELGFSRILAVGHPGKLVKIAQGQWDTHSARGSTAAAWARRFLLRATGTVLPEVATLEELLMSLPEDGRTEGAGLLAGRVARRLARRAGMPARVLLVDLAGNLLGEGMA